MSSTQQAVGYQNFIPIIMKTKATYYDLINSMLIIINANRNFVCFNKNYFIKSTYVALEPWNSSLWSFGENIFIFKLIWTKKESRFLRNNNSYFRYLFFFNYFICS